MRALILLLLVGCGGGDDAVVAAEWSVVQGFEPAPCPAGSMVEIDIGGFVSSFDCADGSADIVLPQPGQYRANFTLVDSSGGTLATVSRLVPNVEVGMVVTVAAVLAL